MWLRDLLPETLPQVRVMTYGYNANFRNFTGHQDIRSIAKKLLSELVDLRRTVEVRLLSANRSQSKLTMRWAGNKPSASFHMSQSRGHNREKSAVSWLYRRGEASPKFSFRNHFSRSVLASWFIPFYSPDLII